MFDKKMSQSVLQLGGAVAGATSLAIRIKDQLENEEVARAQLVATCKTLLRTVQTPSENVQDILYGPHMLSAARIALDAGWLKVVAKTKCIRAAEIAMRTKSDPKLVVRILRLLVAGGLVDEIGINTYGPNETTRLAVTDGLAAGILCASYEYAPTLASMPEYFKKYGYRIPERGEVSIYEHAHGKLLWQVIDSDPDREASFHKYMAATRHGKKTWLDIFPMAGLLGHPPSEVLMVDVGGGLGHDLIAFAKKRAEIQLEGILVLEDLPIVLKAVPESWTMEFRKQSHDFFTPQPEPCLNARLYNLKHILHAWPDVESSRILTHIRNAMRPSYSILLINELVLPDKDTSWHAACYDISMLACVNGKERTRSQWRELVEGVRGLRVKSTWPISHSGETLLEVVREA